MNRRSFLVSVAGAAAAARAGAAERKGFPGTLCFFSKHLPRLDGRGLARALKPLGFGGVDLTVRKNGHIAPENAAALLPGFVEAIRSEGLAVPMITTELLRASDPTAVEVFETAGRLGIPFLKPGYWRYAFVDVRHELAVAAAELRSLAELAAKAGVQIGFHNHSGYLGGSVWDIAPAIDVLPTKWVGYYFDPRHAFVEGGDGGWRSALNLAAPRLKMVAVKDFFWEKGPKGWRIHDCPMGEGMVKWKDVFQAFARARFVGPISMHFEYDVGGATPEAEQANMLTAAAKDLAFLKAGLAEAYGGNQ
jgi:sugar phosphate isomerase/epimerase